MAVTLPDTSSEPRHVLPSDHEYVRHALATQTSPRHPEPVEAAPVKPTLVIGDVHGHFDRLEALLTQEGILADCPDCGGDGDHAWEGDMMCPPCGGDGQRRVNFDVEVVQVGDLGHFGQDASPTGDKMCFKYAADWFDVVLWGNHDRAVVDSHHVFSGFLSPSPEIKHWMHGLYAMDKLKLAHAAHGWLITHAGVQANWKQQKGIDFDRNDPEAFAEWINENDWWPSRQDESVPKKWSGHDGPMTDLERSAMAVRDAISHARGGPSPFGGILWRDDKVEKLYRGMAQVYGHTAAKDGRFFYQTAGQRDRRAIDLGPKEAWLPELDTVGINIDIGSKHGGHLGGVWLPDLRLVRVDL
jgi:hypothetical protein